MWFDQAVAGRSLAEVGVTRDLGARGCSDRSVSETTAYPDWFFDRDDPTPDADFYGAPRLVTHIDAAAIAAVGELYTELGVDAPDRRVLDLMSSWVSHLRRPPGELVVVGMNAAELDANPLATDRVVRDLNVDSRLPFPDASFDAALCCVSVDYLVHPIEVLAETARVLRPGGTVVITFSNRCFPTKAIRGWLATDDLAHLHIVADYLRRAGGFDEPQTSRRTPAPASYGGDPLYAVVARRSQ